MGVLRISISVSAGFTRLIAVGVFRRIFRRAKALWLPKGRGRPSISEDVVELILDMKRSNWSWGALRISQELLLLGIHVHKKTVKRILLENGMVPPKTRVTPPTWTSFLKAHKDLWALDFTCVFDIQGAQVFMLSTVDQLLIFKQGNSSPSMRH